MPTSIELSVLFRHHLVCRCLYNSTGTESTLKHSSSSRQKPTDVAANSLRLRQRQHLGRSDHTSKACKVYFRDSPYISTQYRQSQASAAARVPPCYQISTPLQNKTCRQHAIHFQLRGELGLHRRALAQQLATVQATTNSLLLQRLLPCIALMHSS